MNGAIRLLVIFLVCAFLVERARLLQSLVFFLFFSSNQIAHPVCTTICAKYALSPKTLTTWFRTHPKASNLKFKTQKGPLSYFLALFDFPRTFSALWDFLFEIFQCLQRVPLIFFDILQLHGCWKNPKDPFLQFSAQWECFSFFSKIFYCRQRAPLSIFKIFWNKLNCIFKKLKGSPFTILSPLRFVGFLDFGVYKNLICLSEVKWTSTMKLIESTKSELIIQREFN